MNSDEIRTVIVVDRVDSALGTSATARSDADQSIMVVAATDFSSPSNLVSFLSEIKAETIIFSWRFAFFELLSLKYLQPQLTRLRANSALGVLITDHLGLETPHSKWENQLLENVDFFMVVSQSLHSTYASQYHNEKLTGILHDLPNVKAIRDARRLLLKRGKERQLIWVGNSKWGERWGRVDHKGFNSILTPVKTLLAASDPTLKIRIIDSAMDRLDNSSVLDAIHTSDLLIFCSQSEGTGLPILEALGLGIPLVTSNVGVAAEILIGNFEELIIERNPTAFISAIERILENPRIKPEDLITLFENHVEKSLKERIVNLPPKGQIHSPLNLSLKSRLIIRFKWVYRNLRKRLS